MEVTEGWGAGGQGRRERASAAQRLRWCSLELAIMSPVCAVARLPFLPPFLPRFGTILTPGAS